MKRTETHEADATRWSAPSARELFLRTNAAQTHFAGGLFGFLLFLWMVPRVAATHGGVHALAVSAFIGFGVLVLLVSGVYHFLSDGLRIGPRLEFVLERLDHSAIYLFIAGTYSPVLLHAVQEPWRTRLMVLVWGVAALGMLYTNIKHRLPQWAQRRAVYVGVFIAMGWIVVIRLGEVFSTLQAGHLALLIGGGIAYVGGAVIYTRKRPDPFPGLFGFHEIWHLFVLLGAGLHFELVRQLYGVVL